MFKKEISSITGIIIVLSFALTAAIIVIIFQDLVVQGIAISERNRKFSEFIKEIDPYYKREVKEMTYYNNEERGFHFKYPENLSLEIIADKEDMFSLSVGENKEFRMNIYEAKKMEDYIEERKISGTESATKVSGHEGNFFHIIDQTGEDEYIPKTIVRKDEKLYSFVGEGDVFDDILSTFSFAEKE